MSLSVANMAGRCYQTCLEKGISDCTNRTVCFGIQRDSDILSRTISYLIVSCLACAVLTFVYDVDHTTERPVDCDTTVYCSLWK